MVEFVLVTLLGFMPLIVIHWVDRRPHFRVLRVKPHFRQDLQRLMALTKAPLRVWLADTFDIRL